MKYRKLIVDDTHFVYTMVIQVKKWWGWSTIKTLEHEDYEYMNRFAEDLLENLRKEI